MEGNSVIMLTLETDDRHGVKERLLDFVSRKHSQFWISFPAEHFDEPLKGAHRKKWPAPYQINVTDSKYTDSAYNDTDYNSTIPNCHNPDGKCHNTPGSYDCSCNAPEVGNGFMCKQPDHCHGKDCGPNADCIPLSLVFTGFFCVGVVFFSLSENPVPVVLPV